MFPHIYPPKTFNIGLKILIITNALVWIATFMLVPVYALFVTSVGGTILDVSLVAAVFYLTAGLGSLVMGRVLTGIQDKKKMLIIGYLIVALGYFFLMGVTSLFQIILIQILLGIGEAIYFPSFDTLFTKHLVSHHESEEWGVWESTRYLTMFAGSFLGGAIAFWAGFPVLFLIMSGLCLVSAFYLFFVSKKIL